MAKRKVPKGTKNPDCVALLPENAYDAYLEQFRQADKGDPHVIGWAEHQMAEIDDWRYRFDRHVAANARMTHAARTHEDGLWQGVKGVLIPDRYEGMGFVSVEARGRQVYTKVASLLSEMMHAYRPRMLGFSRDRQGMENFIRELFGEATGDQDASAYASAFKKSSEYVRQRLNTAGARIAKIDDWAMPQYHNPARVGATSRDEWIQFLSTRLDWQRMAEENNMSSTEVFEYVKTAVYDSIVTEGASKIDLDRITGRPQGSGLLNRLRQHRFMHFKNADGWLEYQNEFGHDDYVVAVDNFLRHNSLNIGAMEVLGPNPDIGYQHLKNMLKQEGQSDKLPHLDRIYKNVMGSVGTSSQTGASIMAAIRSANVVAHLGNATLSMITDPSFLAFTARVNDVPIAKALVRQMKISAGKHSDLKFAAQTGLVAEYAADRLLAAARFTDVAPHGVFARLSEMTVRASWMQPITIAGRAAFALEYSAKIASELEIPFNQLSHRRRDAFRRVGITERDWNIIRSKPYVEKDGVKYIDLNYVGSGQDRETAVKLGALIQNEMQYAVPTPGAEVRTWQNWGMERGSIPGEGLRSLMEFKSFPVTLLMLHGRRALHTNAMNRWAYGGGLVASLLVLGWVATAAKDISKGRDPISLFDEDGNIDATQAARIATQAGALGIYGDLILRDATRFGHGPESTLLGPTLGTGLATGIGLAQGTALALHEQLTSDDDEEATRFKKSIGRAAQTYKPEIWQFRALEDRAVNKGLDWWTDGDWDRKMRTAERNRRRETGQTNFWQEDTFVPERPPEIVSPKP